MKVLFGKKNSEDEIDIDGKGLTRGKLYSEKYLREIGYSEEEIKRILELHKSQGSLLL